MNLWSPLQVDTKMNLLNMYNDDTAPNGVNVKYIGNLNDLRAIDLGAVGDVSLGTDGNVAWAFTDQKEPFVMNPLAFARSNKKARNPDWS